MLGLSAGQEKNMQFPTLEVLLKYFMVFSAIFLMLVFHFLEEGKKKSVFQNLCQNSHYQKSQKEWFISYLKINNPFKYSR